MSKRFTATEKWDKPWFRKLAPRLKCLWQFLCDRCDQAGVIEIDWELASFQVGEDVSADDLAAFDGKIVTLKDGKLWLKTFIEFQYGNLSETCPAHKPVFRAIEKHSLLIGYQYPIGRLQEEEEEKEEEKEEETEKEERPKTASRSPQQSDDAWLSSLETDKTYTGISIRTEFGKMQRWCEANRKQPSRKRFVNWLNRVEKPMHVNRSGVDTDVTPRLSTPGFWEDEQS